MKSIFTNRYRHIARYREIVNILSKHGLGHLVEAVGLSKGLNFFSKNQGVDEIHLNTAQRLRVVLEELGPTFIKLGQILSTRPDLLPPDYIAELEMLQDRVPAVSFAEIRNTVEAETGSPAAKAFASLSKEPLATASIGQVHEAYLHTGEHVVVKVQKSGICRVIETDLEILFDMARVLEARTKWGDFYKVVDLVDEFADTIKEELDYTIEARNAERLAANFKDEPAIYVPGVYWNYSSQRVLVLEYIEGIKISCEEKLAAAGIDRQALALSVANAIFKQLLVDGFFHADPHPGNLVVGTDGRVIFLDFGMVGRLDEWLKDRLGIMLLNIVRKDVGGIVRVLLEIGYAQGKIDKKKLRRDIYRLFEKYYNRPLGEVRIGDALRELLGMSFIYRIRVPVELVLMVRSLVLLEGVVERLDPEVSVINLAEPFGRKLVREKFSPEHLSRAAMEYLLEISGISLSLPRQVSELVETAGQGDLKITLEHRDFKNFIKRLVLVGNRISFSLVVAAIIIGSSLIAQRSPKTLLWQIPIAEAGFVLALFMGMWLLVSIIRSGRI